VQAGKSKVDGDYIYLNPDDYYSFATNGRILTFDTIDRSGVYSLVYYSVYGVFSVKPNSVIPRGSIIVGQNNLDTLLMDRFLLGNE
jgi:hypothetical protein